MTSKDCQSLEMDFDEKFQQMVISCPRRNHMKSINLNKQNCKTQLHGCQAIFGFCINKNCLAVSKKVCEYCIRGQLHDKEIGFSYKDLLYEDQVDRIIEMFKQQMRIRLEKEKFSFLLHHLTIFDNLNIVDQIQQDIDRLNNQFIECEKVLENLSILNYIEEVESSNTGLYQYLFQIYQIFVKHESDLQKYIKMQLNNQCYGENLQILGNQQNQQQKEIIRKIKLDLLCKIIQNRIYLEGEIDDEQKEIIESQIEIILKIALDYANERNYIDAHKIYDIISQLDKYKQQAYLNKGIILDKQKKYEEALSQFDKILELVPNNQESLFRKGLTLNHMNQYEQALKFYSDSLNQDLCNFIVWNKMANIYIKLNQYQRAIKILRNLIDKFNNLSQRQQVDKNLLLKSHIKTQTLIRGYQQFQQEKKQLINLQNLPSLKYFYTLEKGNFDKAININPSFYLAYDKKGIKFQQIAQYLKDKQCFQMEQNLSSSSYQQESIYQQGILLYNMGQYEQSLKILQQCNELSKSQILIGLCLKKQQKYSESLTILEGVIKICPSNVFVLQNIGIYYLQLFAIIMMKMNKLNEAQLILNQAIELDKHNNENYKLKGKLLLKLKNYFQALEMFDQAMQLGSLKYQIYKYQGITYSKLKWYSQAITLFDQALQYDPLNIKCIQEKGIALHYLQKYNDALYQFEKVIEINCNYSQGYLQIGITLLKQQKYEESIQNFDMAIKISPENSYFWKLKGIALRKYGKYQQSIVHFDKALLLDPNDITIQNQRVKSENEIQIYQNIINKYSQLIIENSQDVSNYIHKGNHLILIQQYESAKNLFEEASKLDENNFQPHSQREYCLYKINGCEENKQNFSNIIKSNINKLSELKDYAMFFQRMKDFKFSLIIYNLLLQNYPYDDYLKLILGDMKN